MITTKPAIETVPVAHKHRNPAWKRNLAAISRWLHIYLSMVSFAILFFFAVTGLTLNHVEWFGKHEKTVTFKGAIDRSWLGQNVAKLEIVEFLRKTHGIHGAMSDFRVDDSQVTVSFKGPGYGADTFIERPTGSYELTETRLGFVAIINDLHKGRDSGRAWSWIIDISAVLMTLVSLSGIVMLFFLQRRRFNGFTIAIAGALVSYGIYLLWVP